MLHLVVKPGLMKNVAIDIDTIATGSRGARAADALSFDRASLIELRAVHARLVIKLNGTWKTGERERDRERKQRLRCKTVAFPLSRRVNRTIAELKSRSIFSGRATSTSFPPRRINSTSADGEREKEREREGGKEWLWLIHSSTPRSTRRLIEFPPSFKSGEKV